MNILRQLLIFLVGACCLLGFEHGVSPLLSQVFNEPVEKVVIVGSGVIDQLKKNLTETLGREPVAKELELSVSHYIDNEILVNEALLLGLHRADSVVRKRTLMNMKFVANGSVNDRKDSAKQETDEELLRQAGQLGMYRQDIVVRRRLIERMEKIIVSQSDLSVSDVDSDSDSELLEYMRENKEKYTEPAALKIVHGYFSKSKRSENEITALFQKWSGGYLADKKMQSAADQVLVNKSDFVSKNQVDKLFGKHVFPLLSAKFGESGIIPMQRSVGGFHFFRLVDFRESRLMAMNDIRGRVQQDFKPVRQAKLIKSMVQALRGEYRVQR